MATPVDLSSDLSRRLISILERKNDFEIGAEIIHLGSEDLYRFRRYIAVVSKKAAKRTAIKAKPSSQSSALAKASTFAKATADKTAVQDGGAG